MLDVDGKGHLSLVEFADGLLNLLTPHGSEMVQIHSPHLPIYISLPLSHSLSLSLSLKPPIWEILDSLQIPAQECFLVVWFSNDSSAMKRGSSIPGLCLSFVQNKWVGGQRRFARLRMDVPIHTMKTFKLLPLEKRIGSVASTQVASALAPSRYARSP